MKRISTFLFVLILSLGSSQSSYAQATIEDLKASLIDIGNSLLRLVPNHVNIEEDHSINMVIEFQDGYNLNLEENFTAILDYNWETGKSIQLFFEIDSDGIIVADKYQLINLFGTDWDINWNVKFDSTQFKELLGRGWEKTKETSVQAYRSAKEWALQRYNNMQSQEPKEEESVLDGGDRSEEKSKEER